MATAEMSWRNGTSASAASASGIETTAARPNSESDLTAHRGMPVEWIRFTNPIHRAP
jgi:hypothetical protein